MAAPETPGMGSIEVDGRRVALSAACANTIQRVKGEVAKKIAEALSKQRSS